MRSIILAAAAALSFCASDAQARPHADGSNVTQFCGDRVCGWSEPARKIRVSKTATRKSVGSRHAARETGATSRRSPSRASSPVRETGTRILAHPTGCPARSFCGCGLCVHFFGRPCVAGGLAIARNWLGFPPAEPAEGMVAVSLTHSHVFAIEKVLGRGRVLARDYNSGSHLSRLHVRSLDGTSIRNPHGHNRVASLR